MKQTRLPVSHGMAQRWGVRDDGKGREEKSSPVSLAFSLPISSCAFRPPCSELHSV